MPRTPRAARTGAVLAASVGLTAAAVLAVAAPALAGADVVRASGGLVTYAPTTTLERVPGTARGRLQVVASPRGTTTFVLVLHGLLPDSDYGVHAHVADCVDRQGAGHFQAVPAPSPEENDSRFANPRNEVWLDVETDAEGSGTARAVVTWQFRPGQGPRSVIIHRDRTSTEDAAGRAGTAGPKLACLPVAL